jgi:hypothetical protein
VCLGAWAFAESSISQLRGARFASLKIAMLEREEVSGIDSATLCEACHQLIDAASSLMLNVDYLAQAGEDSKLLDAARDARLSIERIVQIANALRSPSPPGAGDAVAMALTGQGDTPPRRA